MSGKRQRLAKALRDRTSLSYMQALSVVDRAYEADEVPLTYGRDELDELADRMAAAINAGD